ncbi:MAG: GIY-YIG nuclease family protein [Prevotellaceae bacterium]|nr:GIY-YIG nuclease family protein [Prevotellaceae bacterium]
MTNPKNKVLYTGVTSRIANCVCEHRLKINSKSFTARYNCVKLVYYQRFGTIKETIVEEKRIKTGPRRQKH